jgi:hypothetical protein
MANSNPYYLRPTNGGGHVRVPNIALTTSWTFESLFQYPLASQASWNTLTRGNAGDHQIIVQRSNMHLGMYDNVNGTGFNDCGFVMSTLANGWHHIAVVAENNTQKYYIDGTLVGTIGRQSKSDIRSIGAYWGDNSQTWGDFDEVRLWSVARTQADIQKYMKSSIITPESNSTLIGYWKCDDGVGTTVKDWSVYARNGTFVGTLTWIVGEVNFDEYYSIIKDNNKFYKFIDNEWIDTGLVEPLTKQNFITYGAFDLSNWTKNTNINTQTMIYERDLLNSSVGKVNRKIVDVNKLNKECGNIQKVEISQKENVVWTSLVGVSANNNNLTKTNTSADWSAGAISTKSIASGNVAISFIATETTSYRMIGFNNSNANNSYTDITFAWYLAINGQLLIYEKGTNIGTFGSYVVGDVFKISYENNKVKYYKNNVLIYTSLNAPVYPAFIDTSIYTPNGTLGNVVFGSGNVYSFIKYNNKIMNYNSTTKQFVDTALVEPLTYSDFSTKGISNLGLIDTSAWLSLTNSFEVLTWTDSMTDIPKLYITVPSYNPIYWLDDPKIYTWGTSTDNQTSMMLRMNITADTNVRYLISKDNKNTWQYFDGTNFQNSLSSEIFSKGMTRVQVQNITETQWSSWFERGYIDFMIGIKSQNPVSVANLVKNITVLFELNQYPIVSNFNISPTSLHNGMVNLSADVQDLEGDNISYQVLVNDNIIDNFDTNGWSDYIDGTITRHISCTVPYTDLKSGNNTIKFSVKDDRGLHYDYINNITVTNTAPYFNLITHDNWSFSSIIHDNDNDKIRYRVLINGIQKYPHTNDLSIPTYSDWIITPANINYSWDSCDLIFNQTNIISIEIMDELHEKQVYSFNDVIGKYKNLMIKDTDGNYYSTDMGQLLKYIDFDRIQVGEESEVKTIVLENDYGYPVQNVKMSVDDSELEYQVCLSKDNSFLMNTNTITFNNAMLDGESKNIYMKVVANNNFTNTPKNTFKIITSADKI